MEESIPRWQDAIRPFRKPSLGRSVWQLVNTVTLYLAVWALMIWSLDGPYWVTLALSVIGGGLTVRLFIINHDCGHGAFFASQRANDIVGFWTGLLAFTPYRQWRHGHALHHATCAQLEERGVGYFWIMTVDEYAKAGRSERLWYRVYRNPFVLFLIGGLWLFLIEFRMSFRSTTARQRRGVWLANAAWVLILVGLGSWIGYWHVFLILFPICVVVTIAGLALFYVQHHYDNAYWAPKADWSYERAALEGSSYIKLDPVTEWFVGAINYHHIHHLAPKVPNYRLKEAHNAVPLFKAVKPLTWAQIRASWRLRLVDPKTARWCDFPA